MSAAATPEGVKLAVAAAVDRLADELEQLSHRIHDTPELCFKEAQAHAWLTELLEKHGARVERGVGGLPTAFRATIAGAGAGPTVAILAEYDALPGIGHACGHNVIAAAGAGAGAALARALGALPYAGRIQVIGTPAEEGGAGKVRLMEAGVFRDVDAAMMIHGRCGTQVWRPSLGIIKVKAEFFGQAAHASSWPWRGVNALNAVIQLFLALDMLRQQLRPDSRVHGIISNGGAQPNIIPEYASAEFYLRALTTEECRELLRRFQACAEGSARATGCRVTVTPDPIVHEPLRPNATIAALFARNLELIDFPEDPDDGQAGYGSTDCGNVSQALPTIHPYIRISPDGVPAHSREFAEWARSPMARAGIRAGAKALAMTALDLLAAPDALREAKEEFSGKGGAR
ncbi:MAG: M20 family metallopeptidase [Candidatus Rokubacteria bacterium]|nr:M20 family metallopeptidase [Candidatus Rokubacteria bacterium]